MRKNGGDWVKVGYLIESIYATNSLYERVSLNKSSKEVVFEKKLNSSGSIRKF